MRGHDVGELLSQGDVGAGEGVGLGGRELGEDVEDAVVVRRRAPHGGELLGIDAARQQMGAVEEEGVGQEQVEVGVLFRVDRRLHDAFPFSVGEQRLDGVEVVVVGL